jgi:hypothetical protein
MNKGCQYARSGETSPTKKHPSELLLWQSRSPQSYASPAKRTSARTVKLASPHGVHLASYRGPPRPGDVRTTSERQLKYPEL